MHRYDVDQLFFVFFDLEIIIYMQQALVWKILMLDAYFHIFVYVNVPWIDTAFLSEILRSVIFS